MTDYLNKGRVFLKSTDFSRALLMGISLSLPILLGVIFDFVQIGIVITVGALLASPSDMSGNIRHKAIGILLSMLIAVSMSLIGGSLNLLTWLKLPVIGILMFAISFISVFGFRASLISFSGLFALVLSFSPVSGEMPTVERALLIGIGGLWYLLTALLWHYLFPKGPTEFYLSKTLNLTSEYLEIRGKLASKKNNRFDLFQKLLQIQTELTETHETLRSILISTRSGSSQSIYEGKRLLIFSLLIDMLELAMANPVDYKKTDVFFSKNPQYLMDFQHLLFEMSRRLKELADHFSSPQRISKTSRISEFLKQLEQDINQLPAAIDLDTEDLLMLRNLYKYQREQTSKIEKIEWLLLGPAKQKVTFIKNEEAKKYLTEKTYSLDLLTNNFHFDSPIFRHSLRMAVITLIGYTVGELFELQNSYWILLTIIVIMRPTFGLTKERSKQRTVGTLIGGVIALPVVLILQNPWIYGILSIITLIISFSMIQKNYKAAAIFITLSVVFSYALLTPDILNVIQYRVMDTLIGTGLATLGNILLWPAWEIKGIRKTLSDTITANRLYFTAIATVYREKTDFKSDIKLPRKKAFTELSNLSAAFQRMTQEPKSRQGNKEQVYELVVLNHTFLSSLASLSTFIIHHPTTPASENFNQVADAIIHNLTICERLLDEEPLDAEELFPKKDVFEQTYGREIGFIPNYFRNFENRSALVDEAHLIVEQLKWLLAMSEKMPKLIRGL